MAAHKKQVTRVLRDLERQGWRIQPKKKGTMLFPPDPAATPVTVHGTPSDNRAYNNFLADLRRSGYTD